MKVLVLGGTRFFGVHAVEALIAQGHEVTIATRGLTTDTFGDAVTRLVLDRESQESLQSTLSGITFDAVIDNIAYASNDIKNLLDILQPKRYIFTSSMSVYEDLHPNLVEADFNPLTYPLRWCDKSAGNYAQMKRVAEAALFQAYPEVNTVAVRFPYVVGADDYTERLYAYVRNAVQAEPMHIDNINNGIGFVSSLEAGQFLAFLVDASVQGPINGCSNGNISMQQVLDYVADKTGKSAPLDVNGSRAPYNGTTTYTMNIGKASHAGFTFSHLDEWIYDLLDEYIERGNK